MSKACVISRGPKKGKLKAGWRFGKNGSCVKKKRKKPCKRVNRKIDGVDVALPCKARTATPAMINKLDDTFSPTQWNSCAAKEGCRVIFFTPGKPVMRRPGRSLKTAAKKRPMPCIGKKGKFVKCGKGGKRARRARARR